MTDNLEVIKNRIRMMKDMVKTTTLAPAVFDKWLKSDPRIEKYPEDYKYTGDSFVYETVTVKKLPVRVK